MCVHLPLQRRQCACTLLWCKPHVDATRRTKRVHCAARARHASGKRVLPHSHFHSHTLNDTYLVDITLCLLFCVAARRQSVRWLLLRLCSSLVTSSDKCVWRSLNRHSHRTVGSGHGIPNSPVAEQLRTSDNSWQFLEIGLICWNSNYWAKIFNRSSKIFQSSSSLRPVFWA